MSKNEQQRKPYAVGYQRAVKQEAARRGIRTGAASILSAMLSYINYDTGLARAGRSNLIADTGVSVNTLDRGLKALRDANIIIPVAHLEGGRGCATVYKFCLPAWTLPAGKQTEKGQNLPQNGGSLENLPQNGGGLGVENGENLPQNGGKTSPKMGDPINSSFKERGGAGRTANVDKAQGDEIREVDGQRVTFRQLMRWHDYGTASHLWGRALAAENSEG